MLMDMRSIDKKLISTVLCLSLLPLLVNLAGLHWGVEAPNSESFALLENARNVTDIWVQWLFVAMAFLAGIASCLHYFAYRDLVVVNVGLVAIFSACLELVLFGSAYSPVGIKPGNLTFYWLLIQSYIAAGLILIPFVTDYVLKYYSDRDTKSVIASSLVMSLIVLLMLSFFLLYFKQLPDDLSGSSFTKNWLKQSYQVIPLVFYCLLMPLLWRRYRQRNSTFFLFLFAALIPQIMAQVHLSFFSQALFDHHFYSAYALHFSFFCLIFLGAMTDFSHEESTAGNQNPLPESTPEKSADNRGDRLVGSSVDPEKHKNPDVVDGELPLGAPKFSLSIRIPLGAFGLSMSIAFVVGYSFYQESRKLIQMNEIDELRTESQLIEPLLSQLYESAASDALFLSGTPPIQGLIESIEKGDDGNYALWKDRLEQIFEQFLSTRQNYMQLRYIGRGEVGEELVNVINRNGVIRRVPLSRMQNKGHRNFFKQTSTLHPGRIFFSDIELNQEWGEVVVPFEIVLRVATPIYGKNSGEFFGIVVLNIDFNRFVRNLNGTPLKDFRYFLADQHRHVLFHPDQQFMFGTKKRLLEEFYPNFEANKIQGLRAYPMQNLVDIDGNRITAFYREISISRFGDLYPLTVMLFHREEVTQSALNTLRNRSLLLSGGMAMLALAVSLLLSRRLIMPLRDITDAVMAVEYSGKPSGLPIHATDETGVLARAIHNSLYRLRQSTDQHQAEKKRAEEASVRLKAIIDAAADAIITIDVSGTILSLNIAARSMFGYTEEELVGKSVNLLMPDHYSNKHDTSIANYLRTGQSKILGKGRELLGRRRNGEEFPVFLSISKVQVNGDILFTGIVKDISEVVAARHAAQESSKQLELVIDSMEVGIWDWDILSDKVTMNKRMADMLGYRLDDISPCSFHRFMANMNSEDMGNARLMLEQHFNQSVKYQAEIRVQHKDGRWLWMLDSGKVLERTNDGKPKRMLGIRLDISDKKTAAASMEEMAWRMEFALSGAKIGIWDMDVVGQDILWDEQMYELYGLDPADVPNTLTAWESSVYTEDFQETIDALNYALKNNEDFVASFRIRHPNGQTRFIEAYGKLQFDANGKPARMVGTNRDITDQKRLQEERETAVIKAEESAKLKSEFLASMSHEIRTPMNGVLGMLGLLQRSELDHDQSQHVKLARSSAESLLTIINDILDFSKVEAGKLNLEMLDFSLRGQLGEFIETVAQRAQEKGLEIVLDTQGVNVDGVQGDPGRLRQILINLVGNAIKFTDSGEIIVRASSRRDGERVMVDFEVTDTGIGIPEEKRRTLFDAFTQVDASTTRQYGGTGLGLAIVRQLCQLMGGDVAVHSVAGQGSTFAFYIELLASDKAPQELLVDGKGYCALLVDAHNVSREVTTYELNRSGVEVTSAESGKAVKQLLSLIPAEAQAPYHVIFIDMKLPDESGVDLVRYIRSLPSCNKVSLVMMTNMDSGQDPKFFAELGCSAYFPKPVTSANVQNAMQVVIHGGSVEEQVAGLVERAKGTRTHGEHAMAVWPSNTRILLVEDNVINQTVAAGLLEDFGLTCDIAGNGIEALDALKQALYSKPYNLVLMDCQMPEMDGYEATGNIRRGAAGEKNRNIVIIAMTANAMKGDRDKCLAAGMTDYISKPIDPEVIESRLRHWLIPAGKAETADTSETPSPMPTGDDEAKMNAADEAPPLTPESSCVFWDEAEALARIRGKKHRLIPLLELFINDVSMRVDALEELCHGELWPDAIASAHTIKGVAANVSAKALAELAYQVEVLAREENKEAILAMLPEVKACFTQTKSILRRYNEAQKDE